MQKLLRMGKWCVIVVLCFIFLFAGFFKLNGNPDATLAFQQYGFPSWFQILIGLAEIIGGIGLLFQKYFRYAAYTLAVIMFGATFTHLFHGEMTVALTPFVFFIILCMLSIKKLQKRKE